ncbi:cell division ATP-binding protein FtsE [Candidatus Falkowbacteria bacterium CG10_big_fil_rev_8_21_14_0_10_43_10]|uniref:Cell division ATP-binding protein FtsE n=1 Tax=Candidatus Falkowbacteria bacterium CG10_big_fil_rev_8_21_14_0_10_43_10 TaxID=1974567 RepID=A0A2H0V2B4_9BACT|nr:MAG: cell division ATP-binding protein FtsE [Candidatus Falkowbacteria bacterium CG10_big_fil_rev_8_21_14_0_10_43_10]
MIIFENVSKHYPPNIKALDNFNIEIKPGEFVSIVGQSGTGKTTMVKLLIGEERATKGRIMLGDWDITNIKQREVPYLRRQIGVIFQDFKLLPQKTLFENVAFAMQVCGEPPSQISAKVPQIFKLVGLEKKMDRYPNEISGGEQQRVVIARSLIHHPKILLADEPTGNLDSINAADIINLLEKINKFGTIVILVTHNKEVVNSLRRRVVTIDAGRVISDQKIGKYIL